MKFMTCPVIHVLLYLHATGLQNRSVGRPGSPAPRVGELIAKLRPCGRKSRGQRSHLLQPFILVIARIERQQPPLLLRHHQSAVSPLLTPIWNSKKPSKLRDEKGGGEKIKSDPQIQQSPHRFEHTRMGFDWGRARTLLYLEEIDQPCLHKRER